MKSSVSSKRMRIMALGLGVVMFAAVSVSLSMQADPPHISIQELKKMMDAGEEVTIIDAQPANIYAEGHIKGAISIPWKSQIALEDVWKIPNDVPILTQVSR